MKETVIASRVHAGFDLRAIMPSICATTPRRAQVLTSMETVAGNYKVMDGKILEKEGKMQILQHKCAWGLLRLSMLSQSLYMFTEIARARVKCECLVSLSHLTHRHA